MRSGPDKSFGSGLVVMRRVYLGLSRPSVAEIVTQDGAQGSQVHYPVLGGELRSDAHWRAEGLDSWHVAECGKCDGGGTSARRFRPPNMLGLRL